MKLVRHGHSTYSLYVLPILLVTSVKFSQSAYSVGENSGMVQITLVLSNPSSTDITIQVTNTDGSANGEY